MQLTCQNCAVIDLPRLSYAGPHIKATCAHCGKYIQFLPKSKILDPKEVRQMIWAKTQDLKLIEEMKQKTQLFHENMSKEEQQIAYYRLFSLIHRL